MRAGQLQRLAKASSTPEAMEELHSVGRPKSRASVPALFGLIATVVARGDVSESTRANKGAVDQRIEEPNRVTELLVHQRNETGPQGCYRTGPAEHELLPIDADDVARSRVRVPRDVGNTTALMGAWGIYGWRDAGRALVHRHGKEITYATTGGATKRILVPDAFGSDSGARAYQLRTATAQNEGTGTGEVGVGQAVGDCAKLRQLVGILVTRPGIAGSATYGHAQGGGCLERLVERIHVLFRPVLLWVTPTDRNRRRFVSRIVDRHSDGVEESLAGVGREVDGDQCFRCYCGHNLDVEHHFAIGAIGVRRLVLSTVDPNRLDFRYGQVELLEVGLYIGGAIAATKFDDTNTLSRAVQTGRKVVELRQFK